MTNFEIHIIKDANVGNVTQVASNYLWLMNPRFSEVFTYDASDQLTAATEMQNQSYSLSVNYGNWGKINSYNLTQTDLQSNTSQSESQSYTYPATNSIGSSQTLFAPQQRTITDISNNVATETLTFGINGSLRKREVQSQTPYTEYYLFNSASNLKAYSYDGLDFAYYGYNASNTRAYKLSMLNQNQWVNGQPQPLNLQLQSAMFYPNAYINFNQNGEYTKHYYNGSERIASRLGDMTAYIYAEAGERLENRIMRLDALFRSQIGELVSYEEPPAPAIPADRSGGTRELVSPPVEYEPFLSVSSLQQTGSPDDIFYYHTNHLGSTAFVTDGNATVTQGFLYAPFGEITTEYTPLWQNGVLPNYTFNAKELDEESGMYYYEARYMAPPTFISRDPMFEQKPWLSPYHYCSNNPVGRVDPSGMFDDEAQANKYYERAVKKYGSERVGNVYNAGNSENPDYQFRIYDKGKEKDKQWTSIGEKGISVCAYKGNSISTGKDYRKYKHSQGDGILTVKTSLTLGAQAGGKIFGIKVSGNLGSIDLLSVTYNTNQKIKFNHVNEYGETTYRMGVSLGFVGYNYTKEPYQDANHTIGFSYKKSGTESSFGINKEGVNVSFGIATIFGINIDVNYKW